MTASSPKLSVEVIEFKPMERNTLRGFVTIRIPAMRLTMKDLSVHRSEERRWVGLPAKPQITKEHQVVKKDGKVQYANILEFDTKEVSEAFGAAVIRALDEHLGDRTAA